MSWIARTDKFQDFFQFYKDMIPIARSVLLNDYMLQLIFLYSCRKGYVCYKNAFTSDGDGINDFFAPQGVEFTEFEMEIYNRWGEALPCLSGR